MFEETGEHLVETQGLVFRSLLQLQEDLAAAGFVVEDAYGGWDERPVAEDQSLFVLVARRPE